MSNPVPELIICFIVIASLAAVYITSNLVRLHLAGDDDTQLNLSLAQLIEQHAIEYGWALKFVVNCFGYACIFVPGILIYKYTKAIKYLERYGNKGRLIPAAIRLCFIGRTTELPTHTDLASTKSTSTTDANTKRTPLSELALVAYCFLGLMVSYLTWGLLQEKIMTQEYESIDAEGNKHIDHFKDSQFLVFANRALAFMIATVYLYAKDQLHRPTAPLFKCSFASFSNIMSAWFQYEALKFVNFPTQVLAKSCKVIPVMLMGKIVSRTKYEFYEYVTAVLITCGMLFFLLGSGSGVQPHAASTITSMTGLLLLTLYLTFDSFTANWQADLFKTYAMTSIQMMCGVNLFSTLFTAASLTVQGGIVDSIVFSTTHPKFIIDCVILSISSAIGQLFIFYTISKFGAVVFSIIMTVRQAFAVLLSCIVYHHHISNLGIFGVFIVFVAIFLRLYCAQRIKSLRRTKISTQNHCESTRLFAFNKK